MGRREEPVGEDRLVDLIPLTDGEKQISFVNIFVQKIEKCSINSPSFKELSRSSAVEIQS